MKTVYFKIKVVKVHYLNAPPAYETLTVDNNGVPYDTGVSRFYGASSPTPPGPFPYVEYEIVDATFNAGAVTPGTTFSYTDKGVTRTVSDNFWISQSVANNFALPDLADPVIVDTSPDDDATGFPVNNDIVFTFNEEIQQGSGTIQVSKLGGPVVAATITFTFKTVTINPTNALEANTTYTITIGPNAILDKSGNPLPSQSGHNFTTGAAPAGVDLTVTLHDVNTDLGIGGHSTTTTPGGRVIFTEEIHNSGSTASSAGQIGYYISTDPTITTADRFIVYSVLFDTVPAYGSTGRQSTTITLPSDLAPGTYYVGVIVDRNDTVAETNNNNNASIGRQITVVGSGGGTGPDLQVTGFSLNSTGWTVGQAITGTYTVTNTGNQTATGSGNNYLMISPDATVSSPQDIGYLIDSGILHTSLAAGQSITRNFSFTPSANQFSNGAGQYYVAIFVDGQNYITESNNNNNIGQARAINVSIPVVAPEIAVSGNGTNIVDGDTTPSTTDFTSFGAVVQGSGAIVRTFTVSNTGNATLTTSGLTLPTGFTLVEGLSASIAAGSSDTFQVRLDTTAAGTKSGQISFTTNDSNENPFNFSVTGTVNAPAIPDDFADSRTDTTSPFGQLATNAQRNGNIEIAGDRDWFRVDLIAGQTYVFRLQGQDSGGGLTLGDPYLRLYGGTGKQLAFNDDANASTNDSQIVYKVKSGGIYYLEAAALGTGLGTYKILSAGPQTREGGAGADIFTATANAEFFFGQAGGDTVSYAAANAPVVANLLSPKKNTGFAAGDSYNSIENLRGSAYADTLIGNTSDNIIEGGPGADSMNGGAGIDTASYANAGAGVHADLQYPQNNTGDARGDTYKAIENLLGSAHNDFLGGDKKVNALNGGNGNDVLYGGFGADRLTGGSGFDSFNFGWAKEGSDVITDFQAGIDEIGIYRTGFGINSTVDVGGAGTADFAAHYFVSSAGVPSAVNPTGVAPTEFGHGQFLFNQTNDTLWWDSDGAGKAKAVLLASFATNVNLTATDFDLY